MSFDPTTQGEVLAVDADARAAFEEARARQEERAVAEAAEEKERHTLARDENRVRRLEAVKLRLIDRMSIREIAKHFGISYPAARSLIELGIATWRRDNKVTIERLQTETRIQHEALITRLLDVADNAMYDKDRIAALAEVRMNLESLRRMFGVDAPKRTEVEIPQLGKVKFVAVWGDGTPAIDVTEDSRGLIGSDSQGQTETPATG